MTTSYEWCDEWGKVLKGAAVSDIQGDSGIRETPLGECIGATIIEITATDPETFLATGENRVFFHLSNGETIYATAGVDGENLVGLLGTDEEGEL